MDKENVKEWLKDKHNFAFAGILLVAIVVRLYYFFISSAQPLWWDEADYLAYAKNLAGYPIEWIVTEQHNSLYPYLAGLMFKLGGSEIIVKFFLQLVPSVLTVYLVYVVANEMYSDKRIGLIASSLMAVFWVHLFNTMRFHVDILGLFFGLLAVYVFWKGYEKKERLFGKFDAKWAILIAVILVIATYTVRRGYFLFGAFFLAYMFLTRDVKSLAKDKGNWIALGVVGVLFFIAERVIFAARIEGISGRYFHPDLDINFLPLQIFNSYFANIGSIFGTLILYIFWIGFIMVVGNLVLSYGQIRKSNILKADLFNLLAIFITLFFFIYVLRTQGNFGEPRWYLPLAFASFVMVGRGSVWLMDKVGNKQVAMWGAIALVALFGFYQIQYSGGIIENRLDSYNGIKQASLHVKQFSEPGDSVLAMGMPQVAYYSERNALEFKNWALEQQERGKKATLEQTLDKIRQDESVKFMLISFSEPTYPEWAKNEAILHTGVWEIPFMDTSINLRTGEQNVVPEKDFGDLRIKLVKVESEVFLYEVIRL